MKKQKDTTADELKFFIKTRLVPQQVADKMILARAMWDKKLRKELIKEMGWDK